MSPQKALKKALFLKNVMPHRGGIRCKTISPNITWRRK
jgi:hypothetical protein